MKKSLLLMLFAFISVVSYSQVSWNAKVGLNLSNITGVDDTSVKPGYQIGVGMEYHFTDMWSIRPSLLFSTKGAKNSQTSEKGVKQTVTFNPMYLELPIMAAVQFAVADNQNIVIKAGPYVACGVGGKVTNKENFENQSLKGSYKLFADTKENDRVVMNAPFKRFDAGLGVGVAYEINRFFADLTGSFGFVKMAKESDSKNIKNTNCALGVGYKF